MNSEEYKNPKPVTSNDPEVDIAKILTYIGNGLVNFFKAISRFFIFVLDTFYRNLKLVGLLGLLGGLLGLGYYFYERPYYESQMTLGSTHYRGQLIKNSMENLNLLCQEGNYKNLSRILNISQSQAKGLKKIEIQPVL